MEGYFTLGFASSFCWKNYAQEYAFLYVDRIMSRVSLCAKAKYHYYRIKFLCACLCNANRKEFVTAAYVRDGKKDNFKQHFRKFLYCASSSIVLKFGKEQGNWHP